MHRQRGEIRQLQRAGIPTASAEALLDRMLNNIDGLCAERDRLKKEQPGPSKGQSPRRPPLVTELKWYDPNCNNPPWIKALAEVSVMARHEKATAITMSR